ncbi:MAG TPA: hypothetical protein VGV63_03605 [Acidimicrobiales bacterium]|nr:hypothetical protein [Acidimicrobiales bacterium]
MGNLLGPVVLLVWLLLVGGAVAVAVAVFRGRSARDADDAGG